MSVIDALTGVEVSITTNDIALKEYKDDELDDPGTKTVYIESASNQEFAVRLTVKKGTVCQGNSLAFQVSMDGILVKTPIALRGDFLHVDYVIRLQAFENAGKDLIPFRFSEIETARDRHVLLREAALIKHLGSIAVDVHHVNFKWHDPEPTTRHGQLDAKTTTEERELDDHRILSEKALKGQSLSHRIIIDMGQPDIEAKGASATGKWHKTCVDPGGTPAAKFIFRYRSIAALKSMLIIPREPTPPQLEERGPTTLSMADILELQKRAKASQEEKEAKVKIKRERAEDDNPRSSKAARLSPSLLEIDDDGSVRECSITASTVTIKPDAVELD